MNRAAVGMSTNGAAVVVVRIDRLDNYVAIPRHDSRGCSPPH